jgi:hypothetical protein
MPPRSANLHPEISVERSGDRTILTSSKTSSVKTSHLRGHGTPAGTVHRYRSGHGGQRRMAVLGGERQGSAGIKRPQNPTRPNNSLSESYDYSVPEKRVEEQQAGQEESTPKDTEVTNTNTSITPFSNNSMNPYGNGYYGNSGMMMMPPMYMGGMGPFSGVYQVLYGVQNIVFSISQAVQLVGMNQQLLQQAWESLSQMFDHAIATFHEMRALEHQLNREETEEDKQRRKRLKALRYALVFGGSWVAYKIVRGLLLQKRNNNRRRLAASNTTGGSGNMGSYFGASATSPYSSSYYGGGMGYGNPYSSTNNSMFYSSSGYPNSGYF